MRKYDTKWTALLLAAGMLCLSACGGSSGDTTTTTAPEGTSDTAPAEEEYDFGDYDFEEREFSILNFDSIWNTYVRLDFDSVTGEVLDDAVYNRNRRIEEKLNFKLKEIKQEYTSTTVLMEMVNQSVMADDGDYDAAYLPIYYQPGILAANCLIDLKTLPGLQLDQPWWDHDLNDSLTIEDKLFMASGPLHLQTLDLAWVLLFNQDMFDDLGLAYPYDLVREGKWTLDKFEEYVKATCSLNGDESWAFREDGDCVYSIAAHGGAPLAFNYAADNHLIVRDGDDYKVVFDTERTFDTMEKLMEIFKTSAGYVLFDNTATNSSYYIRMFKIDRAAFLTCEVKAVNEERDMESTYGLLPNPKFDEAQEKYHTNTTNGAMYLTVPVTQRDPEFAGVVLDALTYESWKTVLPAYYDVRLSQKGLRNDDSIEMLQIVRESRGVEFSQILGLTKDFYTQHSSMVKNENNTLASYAASQKDLVYKNLMTFLDEMN